MNAIEAVIQAEIVRTQATLSSVQTLLTTLRGEVSTLQASVNGVRAVADATNNNAYNASVNSANANANASAANANANAANNNIINKQIVKRVQRGQVLMTTGGSINLTIAAVDMNKSTFRFTGTALNFAWGYISSATNVSITKQSEQYYGNLGWEVTEYA